MNKSEVKKLINFLEELSWVFNSHKGLNINSFLNELKQGENDRNSLIYYSKQNDKSRLIGILPGLLNDKKLFSKNSDLIEFAESAFEIKISRPEKRSRYEIIGFIIMELFELKNLKILDITDSIQELTSNVNLKAQLQKRKNSSDFSWNNAIREITNQ